jgi:phenylacetate-coenzyme A ligase PaaK-like adenylate-forming protein
MYRWFAWNILFRLHEWVKGHPTFQILDEMESADRLSISELKQLRAQKLRAFLDYCYAHVPYVKTCMQAADIQPSQIREPEDLVRLPLMTKAVVRKHRESLRSDIAGRLAPFTTGGSTGDPLIFDLSKRRTASRVACRQRVSRWWGVSVGDPELAVWGSPVELTRQDWVRGVRDRLLSTQLLSAFEMNEETMSRYLDILAKRGCRQLFGYPSAIHLLCLQAVKEGRNLRRLGIKVVFVTGEVLYPYQRELIAETLNAPVANGYGGRDSGFIAHECPQGGMHIMADTVITEILDSQGRPVPPGEAGEIVVTDLYSHEAPFLRYATGDVAALSTRRCPCGRALPLLERIEGRSNDSIMAPDGRIINALGLVYALREVEGIEQFRINQKELDRFHVQIVCTEHYRQESEERIRKGWIQLLRAPLKVTFEYLESFPVEHSGKFRHIVSELAAGGNLRQIEEDHVRPV